MQLGSYGSVSVTTSPTLIIASNPQRKGVIIRNNGSAPVYLGPDSNITTSNTIMILPQESLDNIGLWQSFRGDMYGISTTTVDVRYWEWIS